jgi:two-component system response regulator VanR
VPGLVAVDLVEAVGRAVGGEPGLGGGGAEVDGVAGDVGGRLGGGDPAGGGLLGAVLDHRFAAEPALVRGGAPAAVDGEDDAFGGGVGRGAAEGGEEGRVEVGHAGDVVVEHGGAVGDRTVGDAEAGAVAADAEEAVAEGAGDHLQHGEEGAHHGPTERCFGSGHASREGRPLLWARMRFSICGRYARTRSIGAMRVLVVEDEPFMAEAIRDGLRLEAIAADVAQDGHAALELLSFNSYDIAILDRDVPGPSGDEVARSIVASGSGIPILMLTAADRLDDKESGFGLGADDYLTKPFELRELVLRLRALDRRRAHTRPPVREIAGLRLDPFRREVFRDGRYVALTRKQFAVLEVLVAAEGGVVSAEELLERAWDENADPFTNAVRITVSALRKRLGEPWVIATVAGVGYRIEAPEDGLA